MITTCAGCSRSPPDRELRRAVRGDIRFDAAYRAIYSHDSSKDRQQPIGVVVPRD